MRNKPTSFYLPPDVLEGLRWLAKKSGRSQVEILTEMLRERVQKEQEAEVQARLDRHEGRLTELERQVAELRGDAS